jgi:WD40 repeat protein
LRRAAAPNRGDWVQTLAFSHDGKLVASGGLSTLAVWNVKSGKAICKLSHETHYKLWFAPGDEVLIAQGPGEAPLGWQIATGAPLAAGPDLQALFDSAMLRAGRRWTWDASTDTRPNQMSLALVDGNSGARVAHFPEVRGFIQWHPGGRIWVNQRSRQVSLLQLEGGEVAPSAAR